MSNPPDTRPDEVSMVLTVRFKDGGGTVLGEETVVPEYDERYMNGEECGVTCEQAIVEIVTVSGLET
ncbi:MAG: hypothetical protein HOV80_27175 [Polyangiaceae bacterium]|nr:hypothetical protein [Polyangiaceae bacterium]